MAGERTILGRAILDDFSRDAPGSDADLAPEQLRDWRNALRGAELGNPYATMCLTCSGRHRPPRNDQCPHRKPRS